ncbi:hypothetical protein AUEXF2481DRAFT_27052 [Aureobasidium subglaciale EXF-2481]|uniref:Uncharacterized protein n=1 Tax=Aureobasidium subglaciale (strain EXF-2481) TaxID=1043005 RepID=A0A074ZGK0_AURSE|nr:uncharacterized protein AUEXF2481DRAFT_27052 [Aureobasidium subglaciale EXF-2481]KEQ97686.1 hypothetical protein AUEXF2481DRAFT_27052 [Aureobasidium subglaciale EXF-2481]
MAETKLPTRWIETSDGFIPAPEDQQPTSILHKAVLDAVDNFKITSFDAWELPVTVTIGKKWIVSTWECAPDPDSFKFKFGQRDCQGRTLATRIRKYQIQRGWWAANKKHFALLQLPAELRSEIYRYAAPQDAIEPYVGHRGRGHGIPYIKDCNEMVSNLLKCNKVISQEMRDHMFLHLPLLINHHKLLRKTLHENIDFPRHQLTRLTLCCRTHEDFFKVFGLRGRSIISDEAIVVVGSGESPWSLHRDKLPCIKKFEIIMPSRETLQEWIVNTNCQTKTVTMLLEIMWPYVKGQPVVLGGMIKKWQKKLWEVKAAQAHEEYEKLYADTEDGGVKVTQEDIDKFKGKEDKSDEEEDLISFEEEEEVFEYHLPFFCECHPSCLFGDWTDEDHIKDNEKTEEGEVH